MTISQGIWGFRVQWSPGFAIVLFSYTEQFEQSRGEKPFHNFRHANSVMVCLLLLLTFSSPDIFISSFILFLKITYCFVHYSLPSITMKRSEENCFITMVVCCHSLPRSFRLQIDRENKEIIFPLWKQKKTPFRTFHT